MKNPVKILVVDDDEDDFFIIKEYIKQIKEHEFEIDWCDKYNLASKIICEGKYNLYFIDYLLGAKTGLELIQESMNNNCEEPFILLTGNGNRTIDMKAMKSGAVDYLVKTELSTEKLERCIRYSLERASSLKALKNNERKFRNIFERSKDMIFIATEELVFTEVNNASFVLLDYEREELLSSSLYSFLTNPKDELSIRKELEAVGIVPDKEIDLSSKRTEIKRCILTLSREVDIAGNVYIQGIIHEITALKKAEKATLEIEKMKVADQLVRTLAHEVRNPLSNIILSADQLNPTLEKEKFILFVDIIKRNSRRINDLVMELLNSSRKREVLLQKKSIQSILDDSIDAANDRIRLRNIQLQKDYGDQEAWIMADYEKLKIAFLNIIINAVEAMQNDAGKLTVSVKKNNAIQYIVSIQDNGCGISKYNLKKLFDPYFTTKKNGLGLGLASTLSILQSHNVTIDIESHENQGTVFKLFFNKAS